MSNLGDHFKQARVAKGLKIGQLARQAGYTNMGKVGGRIHDFEGGCEIHAELLERLAAALGIDAETVTSLVQQDHDEMVAEWNRWADEPIQRHLVVRFIACVYSPEPLPPEITTLEQAVGHAAARAVELNLRVCLVWSRRLSVFFAASGTVEERKVATPYSGPITPAAWIGRQRTRTISFKLAEQPGQDQP